MLSQFRIVTFFELEIAQALNDESGILRMASIKVLT
jgi:hypothetical protein